MGRGLGGFQSAGVCCGRLLGRLLALLLVALWSASGVSSRPGCIEPGESTALRRPSVGSEMSSMTASGVAGASKNLSLRRLMQDAPSSSDISEFPVEVSSSVQMCRPAFKTYFFPFANGNRQLVDPVANLKASSKECCASCLENTKCNAWQWCPVEVGCSYGNTTASSAVSNTSFPYLGCQLLNLEGFSMYVLDMTNTLSKGESVPFIAGAPLNVSYFEVAGYDVFPGNELGSAFDFQCDLITDASEFDFRGGEGDNGNGTDRAGPINAENAVAPQLNYNSSATFGCMISGSRTVVADVCTALGDKCQAFDYYEKGFDPTGLLGGTLGAVPFEGPVGVLKTGDVSDSFTSILDLNPNSVVYVKRGVLPESSSSLAGENPEFGDDNGLNAGQQENDDGGSNTVVIVVVSVIVGIVICLGLLVMFYYIKRYQQMTKAFPSPPNSPGGSQSTATPQVGLSPGGLYQKSGPFHQAASVPAMNLDGVRKISSSLDDRLSSDELTSNSLDAAGSETPPSARHLRHILNNESGFQNNNLNGGVVVTEVSLPSDGALAANAGRPGSTPVSATGASARDLMDAFSQMYMKRPAVDYATIGSLKEDDEVEAVKELEAAVAAVQSRRLEQSSKSEGSTKIPSLIRNEATGLEHAGLADDWSILPEEVEVCRRPDGTWWQLGTGGFGTVYRGLYHGIHPVAIKIIHHIEEDRHKDSFIREASLLKALRHRNVVQFLGASLDGPQGTALLVTELMELGDLWRALPAKDDNEERIFGWYLRGAQCVSDVANGLHYLHTKRVVHFDLKSANILLSKAGTAKLADIGMARVLNKSHLSIISGLGTFAWSAPEVLAGRRCTEKADIYSFGVVLWEICTGEAPARGDMRPLKAPEDCPQAIVDLYEQCVRELPEERPSALDVLQTLARVGESSENQ
jgi:hypothetical protein